MSHPFARRSAAGLIAVWFGACAHTQPMPPLSAFAPALQLSAAGPLRFSFLELRGKVVLVTFLATWCFPCVGQLPILEQEQQQHGGGGLQIIAIGMDLEGAEVLEPFAREYQLPFPLLVADDRIRQGQTAFGPIASLPASFLFGRDGRLITAFAGLLVPAELDKMIRQALGESAPR